ncbi:MAG: serine/threonine protein kinase, partial [Clostridia bacterium]|nr:serine/threonine protein kinase [Clostridia bacterium]
MATVYKAKCNLLNRFVAIKVLKDEFAKDAEFVKKFRAEAQSAAALTHPNIVSVYDVGEEDGINYIVMELLVGETLKDYIDHNGKLSNERTLRYASQIASALEAAHSSKIV